MRTEAIALLDELRQRGHAITVAGDRLRIVPKLHNEELFERLRAAKSEILALLAHKQEPSEEEDRIAQQDSGTLPLPDPAAMLIKTCTEFGITLSLESDGTLVIGRGAWAGLVRAIDRYANEVAALLQAGWTPLDA
jgi:hypothetical protein